jgi:hypothetical protein
MQMRCEGTFVLISRKRCTRAQHAPSAVTIELSRALDPLIVRRRQRSHAASTQAQRRRGLRAKPQRHSRRGPAQFLLSPHFMGVSEDRGCSCKHNSSPCGIRAKVEEARSVTKTSVSNRNGARVHRNRIFLRRCYQIFVDEMLKPSTSPRESPRESSDSQSDSTRLSDTKAVLKRVAHRLRIGFTACRLHHLTHEPTQHAGLRFCLFGLVRIGCDDRIDRPVD